MDFLKSISEIKREPLDLKEALERVADYDKERDKCGYEARTILEQNEYDFFNIKHVRLEEVFPSILGFDYKKYTMLCNISKLQKCNEKIVEIGEKEIREIPEDLPDSAKKEIRDHIERDIAKYRIQGSLYSSGGSALCNRINHVLELFRRAYISGDVAICGDWIDLDTIVDTKVFFEWAQRNGFYIPEEVSCFFGDPAATTTTEPGHDQQGDAVPHFATALDLVNYYRGREVGGRKIHELHELARLVDEEFTGKARLTDEELGMLLPAKGKEAESPEGCRSQGKRLRSLYKKSQ